MRRIPGVASGAAKHDGVRSRGTARELVIAAAVLAALSAAANMASPLYPTYQRLFELSALSVTLLYATYALASVPSLLLFGPAADALGRKPVMALGVACAAISTVLFAIADTVVWLFVGRLLIGAALGLATGAGVAVIVEREPSGDRTRGTRFATLSFLGGTGAGPLLTGGLAQYAVAPTVLPYVVMLVVLVGVGVSLAWLPGSGSVRGRRWRPTRPRVPASLRPAFVVAAATGFLGWSVVGIFLALLPAVAAAHLGRDDLATTGAVIAALLLCAAAAQPLAPRLLPHAAQTLGVTMLAIGLGLLVSSYLPMFGQPGVTLVLLTLAAVTAGLGHGLSYWGAAADVDARTSEHRAGLTASLYLLFYLGAGLPAVGVGLLASVTSLGTAVLLFSLLVGLVTVVFLPVPALRQTEVFACRPARARVAARWSRQWRPAGRPGQQVDLLPVESGDVHHAGEIPVGAGVTDDGAGRGQRDP